MVVELESVTDGVVVLTGGCASRCGESEKSAGAESAKQSAAAGQPRNVGASEVWPQPTKARLEASTSEDASVEDSA